MPDDLPPLRRDAGARGGVRGPKDPVTPPLAQVVFPCLISGILWTLNGIDLAVLLSANNDLLNVWFTAKPMLPLLRQWTRVCLPCLLIALVAKLSIVTIPGFRTGQVGCTVGLVPCLIIPAVIGLTVTAERRLGGAHHRPQTADIAFVTNCLILRQLLSSIMPISAIAEYHLKMRHCLARLQIRSKDL